MAKFRGLRGIGKRQKSKMGYYGIWDCNSMKYLSKRFHFEMARIYTYIPKDLSLLGFMEVT